MSLPREWRLRLPAWVPEIVASHPGPHDDGSAMSLAVALAAEGAARGAGGPVGAVVLDREGGLVAAGPNLVFADGASLAHAEMVALTLAQQALGTPDLSGAGLTLVSSAEPCAMCLGALPWSGIGRLVCGARDADVRVVGFDEGAKPPGWVEALTTRGIAVTRDVGREAAARVLREYAETGGRLY